MELSILSVYFSFLAILSWGCALENGASYPAGQMNRNAKNPQDCEN
jgi:hypothetical protein